MNSQGKQTRANTISWFPQKPTNTELLVIQNLSALTATVKYVCAGKGNRGVTALDTYFVLRKGRPSFFSADYGLWHLVGVCSANKLHVKTAALRERHCVSQPERDRKPPLLFIFHNAVTNVQALPTDTSIYNKERIPTIYNFTIIQSSVHTGRDILISTYPLRTSFR